MLKQPETVPCSQSDWITSQSLCSQEISRPRSRPTRNPIYQSKCWWCHFSNSQQNLSWSRKLVYCLFRGISQHSGRCTHPFLTETWLRSIPLTFLSVKYGLQPQDWISHRGILQNPLWTSLTPHLYAKLSQTSPSSSLTFIVKSERHQAPRH